MMRAFIFRFLWCVLVGVLFALAPIHQLQQTDQILYVTEIDGNRDIYVMDSDGSNVQRLTTDSGEDNMPVWSPNRRQIAFISNRSGTFEIFVMNADGSNQRNITNNNNYNSSPAWSPDGQKILFISDGNRNTDVFIMNTDGSQQQNLTNDEYEDTKAAFSPDGRIIFFTSFRDEDFGIYTMNTGGNNIRLFLAAENTEFEIPAFSPDGLSMAYIATQYAQGERLAEIYTADLNGNNALLITSVEELFLGFVSWSADASEIVFDVRDVRNRLSQIRVVNIANGSVRTITSPDVEAFAPSWTTPQTNERIVYEEASQNSNVNVSSCPGTLPSRMVIGQTGRVVPGGVNNRVRNAPGVNATRIGSLDPGVTFVVLDGPVCRNGYAWWEVRGANVTGWTAEASSEEYWIEPYNNVSVPSGSRLLNNGRGLTTGASMNRGEFQVEGYCSRQGYVTSRDDNNWYCLNSNGSRAFTLQQRHFDEICRQTYNIDFAFAVQDGASSIPAFRWRCYG